MANVATELRAKVDNPFRESQLGYRLWGKGWRPVEWQDCGKCGTRVKVLYEGGRDLICANKECRKTIVYQWEHSSFPAPLDAYEIWRRIVKKQWGVDINEQGEYRHAQQEELSEADIERLKQERLI